MLIRGRGQGTEFDSLREYVRGDDVRSIDWRATARAEHVKSIGFILALWSGSRVLNVYVDTISIMYGLGGERRLQELRGIQTNWSRKARDKGILTEQDLDACSRDVGQYSPQAGSVIHYAAHPDEIIVCVRECGPPRD